MQTDNQLKDLVRSKYSEIASQGESCCAGSCCGKENNIHMADEYVGLEGYAPEADLGLGCGLPTQYAQIKPGDTVLDLGSGAGNDCFVARAECGPEGKVIGVDFTAAMIDKARKNNEKLGYTNVDFRLGDIEDLPVKENSVDVVVSNCVLNLVPNKSNVFKEIYRVLKPGGHFSISDIVLVGELPAALRKDAELYVGCVAGAIQQSDYRDLIETTGFKNIQLQKLKAISIPDEVLKQYLAGADLDAYTKGTTGIYSLTVYAEKPVEAKQPCCGPGCCN